MADPQSPQGMGGPEPFTQDDLEPEVLFHDRSFILCGNKHALARRRKVTLAELATRNGFGHAKAFSART